MVLVTGGTGTSGSLASAEIYDPAIGTWSGTSPLPVAVFLHTATLLRNGAVLVVGGYDGLWVADTEFYNPGRGTWTSTGSLNTLRAGHTATLLRNGKLLIAGGGGAAGALSSAELGVRTP